MNEITKRQKIIFSFLGIIFAVLLTLFSGLRLPLIDTKADNYLVLRRFMWICIFCARSLNVKPSHEVLVKTAG